MRKIKNIEKEMIILIFGLVMIGLFVFKDFFFLKNVYIYNDVGNDTINSYWPYLTYLSKMIYSGDFSFWSFNIGIGTSLFSTNPILTDPFNILAALWGPHLLVYVLPYIALMKIMIAALGFYTYLKYIGVNKYASLIASLLFGFNGFIILWGQHYHMGTIIVFIPFVLLGFEKWLKEKKNILYIISLFFVSLSSYYFLYMFVAFFVIYVLIRYFEEFKFNTKTFFEYISKIAGYSILAIGLSSFILLPSIYVALNNPRINGQFFGADILSFANVIDYLTIIFRIFSNDILGTGNQFHGVWNYYEAPMLYTGTVSLVLVPLFFVHSNRKSRIIYGLLLLVLFLFLLFPFSSLLLNAFSANSYRWTFIIIVFVSIINAKSLNYIFERKLKINTGFLMILFSFFLFTSITSLLIGNDLLNWGEFFTHSFKYLFISLVLLALYCLNMKYIYISLFKRVFLILICLELASFSSITVNRVMLSKETIESSTGYNDYTKNALEYISSNDLGFYRIDKSYNSVFYADAMIQGYKGVKSYNSLNQPAYLDFLRSMEVPFKNINHPNYLTGLDSNTNLNRLLGVKYFLVNNAAILPNGYRLINESGNIKIYQDDYALPLGFAYDNFISYEEFSKFNVSERSDILLKSFVSKEVAEDALTYKSIDLSRIDASNVFNTLPLNEKNISLINIEPVNGDLGTVFTFNALNNDPQIVLPLIKNENMKRKVKLSLKFNSNISSSGQLFFGKENNFVEENTRSFNYIAGDNYLEFIFDYPDIEQMRFDISNAPGTFTISDFKMQIISNESLDDINNLKKNTFNLFSQTNDFIKGSIETDTPKKLFLSIPYDKGWKAKINGKKVDVSNINLGFIGIDLQKGDNIVELSYMPPLLIKGLLITIFSLVVILVVNIKKLRYIFRLKSSKT